ncbi:hypothetical protein [Spirosoma pomorum]
MKNPISKKTDTLFITEVPLESTLTINHIQLTPDENTTLDTNPARECTNLFFFVLLQFLAKPDLSDSFRRDIQKALPFLQLVIQQIEGELAADDTIKSCTFGLHNVDRLRRDGTSQAKGRFALTDETLLATVAKAVTVLLQAKGVLAALRRTLLTIRGDLPIEINEPTTIPRLFSNSKDLKPNEWAMPKFLADNLSRLIKDITLGRAISQYEAVSNRTRNHKPSFKVLNRNTETEFLYNPEQVAINTAEEFANQLLKLKDAKVLQVFFALWKWASRHDRATFKDVPLSELMALCLKTTKENKFNTKDRREFSDILEYLASMTITESILGERVNKRTGKSKPELREEKGVRVFHMEATYSIKKEFRALPKTDLDQGVHFDKTVITRFSGTLLPNKSHLFNQRASIFFDNLLQLDANKDSKAIVLGFHLQTRFNQLMDKSQPIELDRDFLIHLCDYQKTNQAKPSQATKQLRNNLDKLINVGIISGYSGLTNTDTDRVKLVPPKLMLV